MSDSDLTLRRASSSDRPAIISLCRETLGWNSDDPNEAFFRWKHDENPFGESPSWVAETPDGRILGLRVFLQWQFRDAGGRHHRAVRAVDTATHPDAQGQGIFTRLTTGALPDLTEDGIGFVFNTPNDKSRPGYLRMGWSDVGQVPVAATVRSPASAVRLRGARAAADLWSQPSSVGVAAGDFFASPSDVQDLLDAAPKRERIATVLSPEFLHWRYRFDSLHYRVLPFGDHHRDGAIVFRVRRRGTATEVAVCDVFAPRTAAVGRGVRSILNSTGADYAVGTATSLSRRDGCLPVPRIGPILTWRELNRTGTPAMSELAVTLGDIELF